jgi:hypothetical protein
MTKERQRQRKGKYQARQKMKETQNILHDLFTLDAKVTNALNTPSRLNPLMSDETLMAHADKARVVELAGFIDADVRRLAVRVEVVRTKFNPKSVFNTDAEKHRANQIGLEFSTILEDFVETVDANISTLMDLLNEAARKRDEAAKASPEVETVE